MEVRIEEWNKLIKTLEKICVGQVLLVDQISALTKTLEKINGKMPRLPAKGRELNKNQRKTA